MNKCALGLLLCAVYSASFAEVYKWIDSQGVAHFSDIPHEGAERLTLPNVQSFSPPRPPSENPSPPAEQPEMKDAHVYTMIAIKQPQNETTIRNPDGFVVVAVDLKPDLSPGDSVQLLFDGAPIGDPQSNLVFQLNGIYRGSHTLAAQVLDANGTIITTSEPITIFMQNPRVGMGNKGRGS